MIRVQIYLDEKDDRWLEEQSSLRRTSKAALVREGVRLLRGEDERDREQLLQLIGLAGAPDPEGATDVSERHDWYLTEWEYRQNHPGAGD